MKKMFLLFAALAILACLPALADVITTPEGWKYEVARDGTTTLRGYEGEETRLTLPTVLDGYTVTAIGRNAFDGNVSIREVTIPDGYLTIGFYAFRNCTRIGRVSIPGSLQNWERDWGTNGAFMGCTNLIEIDFGEGLTAIGTHAFQGCTLLEEVALPSTVITVGEQAFRDCELLDVADVYGSVENAAFFNCSYMSSLTLHNAVSIGSEAFEGCTSLRKVTLPATLTSIGNEAFRGCSKLQGIEIPAAVTSVGFRAFYDCKQLKLVSVGGGVASWGADWGDSSTFAENPQLSEVILQPGLATLPKKAFFNCGSLQVIRFPEGMTSIGESAFENCGALTQAVFADSITEIAGGAFRNCALLAEFTLPAGLETIGNSAFRGTAETALVIPSRAQTIGVDAFRESPNLVSVTLGESVTNWINDWGENRAFYGCGALTTLTVEDGVNSIGNNAFQNCVSLTSVEIPSSSTSVGDSAFRGCTGLQTASVYRGTVGSGAFMGCTALTTAEMRRVTSIGGSAFEGCVSLSEAELPRTLITIGGSAFKGCSALTEAVIPDSVTEIGAYAFRDCTALRTAWIGNNVGTWRLDWGNSGVFRGCGALEYVYFEDDGTTMGDYSLQGCTGLRAVYIPRSILNIPNDLLRDAGTAMVIYGQPGSAAEAFAQSKGIEFRTDAFPYEFDN